MNKFITQTVLMFLAIMFLLKGGMSFIVSAWRVALPAIGLAGGYYFFKKAMEDDEPPVKQKVNSKTANANFTHASQDKGVIEICPYCLSEVGSCPKCRKS